MDYSRRRFERWVNEGHQRYRKHRQSVHIVLYAITQNPLLKELMVMKGGMLMALRYQSPRFTKDIDFSTDKLPQNIKMEEINNAFKASLPIASSHFDYDLECRVQSCTIQPTRGDATYPSIRLSIGSAYRSSAEYKRLVIGQSPSVVTIDFSLNETILFVDRLLLENGDEIKIYGLTDLIAEKIRSLLQQPSRKRARRQDVFDLGQLLKREYTEPQKLDILRSINIKCRSRGIEPNSGSISDPQVKSLAKKEYPTLAQELEGALPDFEESYERIERFYCSLPWI